MRIIFMGTPDFSVGTLEAIIEAGHEVVLAVTQPDKPKGRGKEMQFTPVKECAIAHNIPVFQPQKVREAECVEKLKEYNADIMVVIAFGQILPKEILELTPYGCVNVHASLLPKYRGAAPLQWCIIDGEEVTGITTMQMDEGLDTGDMLLTVEIPIDRKETYGSIHDKMASAGAKLLVETLVGLEEKTIEPKEQGEMTTEYAKMIKKQLGDIEWSRSAVTIERLVRGLNPWPSAYTNWNGKVMKIWDADILPNIEGVDAVPGTIVATDKTSFSVMTGDGILKVNELQIPGKKRMDAGAFLRGYQITAGEQLTKQS
ncbi:MAG: methionyl-tRNA formyltransferase [Eubacteriales bacterium]